MGFSLCFIETMIDKKQVEEAVNEWLKEKEYFLVELSVEEDDRIVVVIDHKDGVWIDDCAELSRFIESKLDRDDEDYELEVGSAGLGQPFKVAQQWENHVGKTVETFARDGHKYQGTLTEVTPEGFTLLCQEKVKEEGRKRPVQKEVEHTFSYGDVTVTRYVLKIK